MPRNGPLAYFVVAMLAIALVALGIVVFQFDNLEQRFLIQSQQLRALGDATDRLAGRIDQLVRELSSGQLTPAEGAARRGGTRASRHPDVQLLHPEVPNFLAASDFHYPPLDAAVDGTLARGWPSGFILNEQNLQLCGQPRLPRTASKVVPMSHPLNVMR